MRLMPRERIIEKAHGRTAALATHAMALASRRCDRKPGAGAAGRPFPELGPPPPSWPRGAWPPTCPQRCPPVVLAPPSSFPAAKRRRHPLPCSRHHQSLHPLPSKPTASKRQGRGAAPNQKAVVRQASTGLSESPGHMLVLPIGGIETGPG